MAGDDADAHRARQQQLAQVRVETFVVRARRIEAHSLASDRDRLRALSSGTMKLTVSPGVTTLRIEYPPEEQIESAAARVRPLMLDDVSLPNVLKALTSLTAGTDDRELVEAWATAVRARWNRRTGRVPNDRGGYVAMLEDTSTGETGQTDQIELARAWIYGDVVHHDPDHLERTRAWGVGERFRAAVPMVAYAMIEAIDVLENIRELERRALIHVAPEAWRTAVLAENPYEREAVVHVGAPGAPMPSGASNPLSADWTKLGLAGSSEDVPARRDDQP